MRNDLKLSIALVCFVSVIYQCNSCINGSNMYLGAVFEPYTKSGGRQEYLYPETEIISMIQIVSSRFHRISTYGNEGNKDSVGSKVLVAAAKANSNAKNTRSHSVITVNAAIWQPRDITIPLNEVMSSITTANNIFPGTVTGLIIRSDSDYTQLGSLTNALRLGKNQIRSLNATLRIGTRLSNCEELANRIANKDKLTVEMFNELDFVICQILPIASRTPEDSATRLISKFTSIFATFRQEKSSLEVIAQTGLPTSGGEINGIAANVASMNRFWCEMNKWSEQNSIKLDFFEAFDQLWKKDLRVNQTELHFGWWIRVKNDSSNPEDFVEKILHKDTEQPLPDKLGSSTTAIALYTVGSVGFITLIIIVGFLYYKLKFVENLLLSQKDIEEFEKGCVGQGKDDAAEDALRLPYDRRFEIPKSKFRIDYSLLLGKGAFGAVYKGQLEGKENDVAFKMTLSNCTSTSLKSLLSEIKIMIHVGQHPNVVCIIGAFTGEMRQGRILIATELCDNGTLESYLQAKKQSLSTNHAYSNDSAVDLEGKGGYANVGECIPLLRYTGTDSPDSTAPKSSDASELSCTLKKLRQWSYEIANGMEYIASRNVIHADLAARNVLLTSGETAKITDFGLSRRLYEYTNYVKQNQEPMPWRWMAIESLEQLNFSTKSDVWSFGVTLYEIFSLGDIPYPGLSWNQDFTHNLRNGLQLTKPRFASDPIYQIMTTCWALNSNERPQFSSLKESLYRLM